MALRHLRQVTSTALLLLAPALASAQIVVSTGTSVANGIDTRWQMSVNGGAFGSAFVLNRGSEGGATWIGASASGSLSNALTSYSARTQFSLNAGDLLSFTLRCTADNTPLGVFINGQQAGPTSACGPANTYVLSTAQTFSSFIAGLNTLEVRWTGDGITDGGLVAISNVAFTAGTPGTPGIVPEPSTYALMISGLGMLAMARRRRNARA